MLVGGYKGHGVTVILGPGAFDGEFHCMNVNPTPSAQPRPEYESVNLRDPALAVILGFVLPGLGHIYQGRRAKGLIYLACILGIFVYGNFLGEGRVVYASFSMREEDRRLPYLAQMWIGLPAAPALIQKYRAEKGKSPILGGFQAPPRPSQNFETGRLPANRAEWTVSHWSRHLGNRFEIGTVYCMVAGLLNLLVVFDAAGGPVPPETKPAPKSTKEQVNPPKKNEPAGSTAHAPPAGKAPVDSPPRTSPK